MKMIDVLRGVQLVDHLTEEQIGDLLDEMNERNLPPTSMLHFIPGLVYKFDCEYWWDPTVEASYMNLITDLVNLSQERFRPVDLDVKAPDGDDLDYGDKLLFSFKLEKRKFKHILVFKGDVVDLSFITVINRALNKVKIDGQFYWLVTYDQIVAVIYLTKHQFNILYDLFKPDLREYKDMFDKKVMQDLW